MAKMSAAFVWSAECEEIRGKIVQILTEEPVLMIFDSQYEIELHTDASSLGYGAILFQLVDELLGKQWQQSLGDVKLAINSTVNRTTKVSPLELMICRVVRPVGLTAETLKMRLTLRL